MIVELRRDW